MSSLCLETSRLLLLPFTKDDTDDLHRLWTEPRVRQFLWDDQMISRETVIEVVKKSIESFADRSFGFWTLRLKFDPQVIGFCGLRLFQTHPGATDEVEILYGLFPHYWAQGLATEAAIAVLRHGFESAGLEQIYAGADPPNEASFRVMTRLGMKFAQRITLNGNIADYYALTHDDSHLGGLESHVLHEPSD